MTETQENPKKKEPKKINKTYARESAKVMGVAFELGFLIALPIVVLALLGKYLDQKNHTGYFIYIGIALAILTSSFTIYRRFAAMIQKLNDAAGLKPRNKPEHSTEDKEKDKQE